jgi:hypothetical protein
MELRDMNGVSPYQRARRAGHDDVAMIIRDECQVRAQTDYRVHHAYCLQKRRELRKAERELRMTPSTVSPSAGKSFHKSLLRPVENQESLSDAPTDGSYRAVALPAPPWGMASLHQLRKGVTDLLPGTTCGNIVLIVTVVLLVMTNLCTLWYFSLAKR